VVTNYLTGHSYQQKTGFYKGLRVTNLYSWGGLMKPFKFKWKNFRCFEDTDWIEIKPLTIFIGPNNSGKTSLILPFLLMKQSIESLDLDTPLKIKGEYVDLGSFKQFVNNGDLKKKVEFNIRFIEADSEKKQQDKYFKEKPVELNLIFKGGTEKKQIRLDEFVLKNYLNEDLLRIKLRRKLYEVLYYKFPLTEEIKNLFFHPKPNNFLFLPEPVISQLIEKGMMRDDKVFRASFAKFIQTLSMTKEIWDTIERIDIIGPSRENPQRIYSLSGDRPRSVGPTGNYTSEILWLTKGTSFERRLTEKLDELFGIMIKVESMGRRASWAIRYYIKEKKGRHWLDIADVGFGFSQLLPIIIQGLYTQKNEIFISEQPEIHLNPKLQSLLGNFFVHIVKEEKKFVILETHSEHILLRIRRLIAEGAIDSSEIALYFVQRSEGISKIIPMKILENGHIEDKEWPEEFFSDTIVESLNLASAQREWYDKNVLDEK